MVSVMVIEKRTGPGPHLEGLGSKKFRVMPRVGERIELSDAEGKGQLYEVLAVQHPGEPVEHAGDIYITHLGPTATILSQLKGR